MSKEFNDLAHVKIRCGANMFVDTLMIKRNRNSFDQVQIIAISGYILLFDGCMLFLMYVSFAYL